MNALPRVDAICLFIMKSDNYSKKNIYRFTLFTLYVIINSNLILEVYRHAE